MHLFEHEAKELLGQYGLETPNDPDAGYVVKAQVLTSDRKKHGGIEFVDDRDEAQKVSQEMKNRQIDGHPVEDVLIEPRVDIREEYYIALLYDTDHRQPVLVFSTEGGTGIESRRVEKLSLQDDVSPWYIRSFLKRQDIPGSDLRPLTACIVDAIQCFFEEDARMLEINPLARTGDGYRVIDAMIDLDDDAFYRHDREYDERSSFSRSETPREVRAKQIDRDDHRGIAGKYTELDGDIGMMLAGGGASLTNMDALIAYGGDPANYTEYGGNPPTEKVYRLSKIIMDKPGLRGLWHVGGTANNTDIHRTMKGFCQALREVRPDYPIVVRRDGPNADEGFRELRQTRDELGLDMKLFRNSTPMTETARILVEMVEG